MPKAVCIDCTIFIKGSKLRYDIVLQWLLARGPGYVFMPDQKRLILANDVETQASYM